MEARLFRLAIGWAWIAGCVLVSTSHAQFGNQRFVAQSQNFVVFASSDQLAREVSVAAEKHRFDLAEYWLGQELPPWSNRCPVHVTAGPQLGAGGETRFTLLSGHVGNWMMSVQGTPERIIDSVLPHEITHTVFASYFAALNKHVPRWADEGACTTVEHPAEKNKHNYFLEQFLRSGRGLSFNRMFTLKDYPNDILPLYAQGHSVVQFLIDQGGPRKFIAFIEDGLRTDDWEGSVRRAYAYKTLGEFKQNWNQWLADGRPDVALYAPSMKQAAVSLASAQQPETLRPAKGETASNSLASSSLARNASPLPKTHVVLGNDSWYRRQLKENVVKTASSATSTAAAPRSRAPALQPPGPYQASSRPRPVEGPQVQVLDWGTSQPTQGLQAVMVPLPAANSTPGSPHAILR